VCCCSTVEVLVTPTTNPSTLLLHSRSSTVGGWLASVLEHGCSTVSTVGLRCEWCGEQPCDAYCTCLDCVEYES
jgi:hypothetical protein